MNKRISHLRINECGRLKDKLFIVINRWPEDRASGGTYILYEGGPMARFIWDWEDPEVEFLGAGIFEIKLATND